MRCGPQTQFSLEDIIETFEFPERLDLVALGEMHSDECAAGALPERIGRHGGKGLLARTLH